MEFSVVELGYDREQVDHCLEDLGEQLATLTARAETADAVRAELALVREEVARLRRRAPGRPAVYRTSVRLHHMLELAQQEAAEIVAQAHEELAAARREAAELRDRAYNEALQARRDFEAALQARRRREQEVDLILRQIGITSQPAGDVAGPRRTPPSGSTSSGSAPAEPGSSDPASSESAPRDPKAPRRPGARWPRIRNRMISAGR